MKEKVMTPVNLDALIDLVDEFDKEVQEEINEYVKALQGIKKLCLMECNKECKINFCQAKNDDYTCVVFKIKNKIDEVLKDNEHIG